MPRPRKRPFTLIDEQFVPGTQLLGWNRVCYMNPCPCIWIFTGPAADQTGVIGKPAAFRGTLPKLSLNLWPTPGVSSHMRIGFIALLLGLLGGSLGGQTPEVWQGSFETKGLWGAMEIEMTSGSEIEEYPADRVHA